MGQTSANIGFDRLLDELAARVFAGSAMARGLLTPVEAAKVLKVSINTLSNWRVQGFGPQFRKVGKLVRYPSDLL
jgi:hypothetical protein